MLEKLETINKAIDMMLQETDASQQTKSWHFLKNQFQRALNEIDRLERMNKALSSELEQYPEYRTKKLLEAFSPYMDILNKK